MFDVAQRFRGCSYDDPVAIMMTPADHSQLIAVINHSFPLALLTGSHFVRAVTPFNS